MNKMSLWYQNVKIIVKMSLEIVLKCNKYL